MIDYIVLEQLKHPSEAHRYANLQRVLVLDIAWQTDDAILVETRSGKHWLPFSQTYYAPESTHDSGVLVYIPKRLADKKFGVLPKRAA